MADAATGERIVDPPLVDHLWFDAGRNDYVITFVPDQAVSAEATEVIAVSNRSPEGRIIQAHLEAVAALLGFAPARIVHSGAGDLAFHTPDGSVLQLSDAPLAPDAALRVHDELKAVAETAQATFRIAALAGR